MTMDRLVHRVRAADGEPEGALVLLHGRGTSEHDLFPLLDILDPERRLVGVTPRGPMALPPGGAHWYGPVLRVGYPDPDSFHRAREQLVAFVDGLGMPPERTVIGGFSQGAVMSYAMALGDGRPRPAGLIALSGFMPEVPGFELDLSALGGYPVAVAHGTHDPIISVEFGRDARRRLEEAGADVLWRESPMPHTVDPDFLREVRDWLANVVPSAATR